MKEYEEFSTVNIREYLMQEKDAEIGEDMLRQMLDDFSCPKNPDVERFLKEQSVDFTKKHQSVTYLVISSEDAELLGYFSITIKPITINIDEFSNTMKRKISRVSVLNEELKVYNLSAYLIAQIGKNFSNEANERITGKQLLDLAIDQVKEIQHLVGGMVIFLEAEENEKLMKFYKEENSFLEFDVRETVGNKKVSQVLIQMLRVI